MLTIGSRLGPYEVTARLGEGGMGEVYRARDTRLGRDVAIKVLPISSHSDPALRSRFEREAQALASLNHPGIAAIYDVVDAGDHRAIIMELVAGSTLAERLGSGPLPVRVALGYGIEISNALGAAHAAGIVHRDLKPSNIVITEGGSAKLLDFGIAKRCADGAGTEATATALTGSFDVLGTVGYMSPEQAHGRDVDARTDIFSLGVVLYEALSGRRPFQGDTTAALLSAVLRDHPPPLRTIAPSTPRAVERCVMRCLEKDTRRRYQHAADLEIALEDLRSDLEAPEPASASRHDDVHRVPTASSGRRWKRAVAVTLAAPALAAVGYVVGVGTAPPLPTPRYRPFITEVTSVRNPVWSPDGRTLAYIDVVDGSNHVFVRGVDSGRSMQLTTERASGDAPFWSPDGSKIYFSRADGTLVSVGAGGGEPQRAIPGDLDAGNPFVGRACISPDGATIVFARGTVGGVQLWALDTATGRARTLEFAGMPRPLVIVQSLAFSPDGRTLAITASMTAANTSRGIWMVSWPDGAARHVAVDSAYRFPSGSTIGWMPDSRRVVVSGSSISDASRLLMVEAMSGALRPLTGGKEPETDPAVAPDGTRVAFVSGGTTSDLVQFPVDGGAPEPLVATSRRESHPDLSAGGLLAYITNAEGSPAVRVRSRGDSWSRALVGTDGFGDGPPGEVRLSPDGQRAAVGTYSTDHVIWILPTAGGTPLRIDPKSTDHHGASWSPDGNWISYRRLLDGAWSIVKVPLGGGVAVRLDEASPGGGPTDWSPTGQWIAHSRPDGMHLVPPDGGPIRVIAGLRSNAFRFSRDGSRLFALRRGERRQWELVVWDIDAARELRAVALPVESAAELVSLAVTPDNSRIVTEVVTNRSDIWLLEQFDTPTQPWFRWLRR